jgi:hypothetical protein
MAVAVFDVNQSRPNEQIDRQSFFRDHERSSLTVANRIDFEASDEMQLLAQLRMILNRDAHGYCFH